MVDTVRSLDYIIGTELPDGQPAGSVTLQRIRDTVVSLQAAITGQPLAHYYVDSVSGNDINNGTTIATPFASLSAAMAAAGTGKIIALKCGSVFTSQITPLTGQTWTSYGTGALPQINLFSAVTGWSAVSGTVYSKSVASNAGCVKFDGNMLNFQQWNSSVSTTLPTGMVNAYTFDHNSNTLYISVSSAPSGHTVLVALSNYGVYLSAVSNVTVSNIEIVGAARHGVDAVISCQNCTLSGLVIHDVGGQWDSGANNYLGNGIEFADGSSYCTVQNCTIWNCMDSAFTTQLYSTSYPTATGNSVINSTLYNSGFAGIELGAMASGTTVANTTITGNQIYSCGNGWSGNRSGKGHGIYAWIASGSGGSITGTSIKNNRIYLCYGYAVYADQQHGSVSALNNVIEYNNGGGFWLADGASGNNDAYTLTGNTIRNNAGSGVILNNWNTGVFSLISNSIDSNGVNSSGNCYIDGSAGVITVTHNIFSGKAGPAFSWHYSSPGGTVMDYNTFIGAGTLISYNGNNYTSSQGASYIAAAGHDTNSVFYAG